MGDGEDMGTGLGTMREGWDGGVLYLRGWPDDREQDRQQHQPVEQPQQRQDGQHRKKIPERAIGTWGKQAQPS